MVTGSCVSLTLMLFIIVPNIFQKLTPFRHNNLEMKESNIKEITPEELSKNNGRNGNPSYVVVDGKVWDVSSSKMWSDGYHVNTHHAGQDLSIALQAAPHSTKVMGRFELVGEFVETEPKRQMREFPEPSPLISWILAKHPHPISAHLPMGLGIASSLFIFFSLLFDAKALPEAAFYNLILTAITAPLSAVAGLLSWYYNYGGVWTTVFRVKALLSIFLILILASAIVIRLMFLEQGELRTIYSFIYYVLVLLIAPTVAIIGRLGGKITFPS
jgi:predicted heme/steroid binding protein/uncharacterized membrane protein